MASVYFYYSAMNAGKSATLLQSNHNYRSNGMHTALFTPRLDDRYGEGQITSRIGLQASALVASNQTLIFFAHLTQAHAEQSIACVLIDESQFLTRVKFFWLTMVVDQLGIPVLCYGLRTDFRGEPFEGSQYLLAWADIISEIKTICHSGRKAIMNARLDAEGKRVWDGSQVEMDTTTCLSPEESSIYFVHRVSTTPLPLQHLKTNSRTNHEILKTSTTSVRTLHGTSLQVRRCRSSLKASDISYNDQNVALALANLESQLLVEASKKSGDVSEDLVSEIAQLKKDVGILQEEVTHVRTLLEQVQEGGIARQTDSLRSSSDHTQSPNATRSRRRNDGAYQCARKQCARQSVLDSSRFQRTKREERTTQWTRWTGRTPKWYPGGPPGGQGGQNGPPTKSKVRMEQGQSLSGMIAVHFFVVESR